MQNVWLCFPELLIPKLCFTAGVAVLPQDPAIEAAGVDPQLVGHQEAESGRVQVGAAADDAVLGEAAQLPGHVGQHVNCRKERLVRGCAGGGNGDGTEAGGGAPGLDTTMMMQSGLYLTICGTMCLKMLTLRWTRLRRLSPSCWRTPAVITTMRELAVTE